MAFYDYYKIDASEILVSSGRQETRQDFQLTRNNVTAAGGVSGRVLNAGGSPISDAVVKLNTSELVPFEHTNTNPQGNFSINNVPTGSYYIAAIADGYLLPVAIPITVNDKRTTNITITLTVDPDANKNSIFGIVSTGSNVPVSEAKVELYKKSAEGPDLYMGVSATNEHGQYFFVNLDGGEYYISAGKSGYYTSVSGSVDVLTREYSQLNVNLVNDPQSNTGVICGVITDDENGSVVPNAVVALYIVEGGVERIIQFTKTSIEGKYMFGNIQPGSYRVKATVQTEG